MRKLTVHKDNRGVVAEVLRPEDVGEEKFGQILLSTAYPGQTKGEHYHLRKKEWYCVIKGNGRLVVTDQGTKEQEILVMGESNMVTVEIPTGYLHSIENVGETEMILIAYTNEAYDPNDPDTFSS